MGFLLGQKILIRRSWRPPELSELRGARECGVQVYAGLAKLIRREQWSDTYAEGLWVIPAA